MFAFDAKNYPVFSDTPVFPVKMLDSHDWGDGLLIRSPNWLGDAVMTFPALKQLKRLLPEKCGLLVAAPRGLVPLYKALSCVDQVIPLRNAHAFPSGEERNAIRCAHPGAAVLFNKSFRDALALKLCFVPRLFGTAARFRSLLLTRSYSFPARKDQVWNKPHQALKHLALAYSLGAPVWDGVMPELIPDPLTPPGDFVLDICGQPREVLLLAPGAAYGDAKRWDAPKFREIARWWIDRGGLAVTVGGKGEIPAAEEVLSGLPPSSAVQKAGRTTLTELIHLLKHASLCVANDSGVMHLGTAAGTRGVAIFGSTDPAATGPLSRSWKVVCDKQFCSPCFRRNCPLGTRDCFQAVSVSMVRAAAEEILSGKE